jgi:hypothetical protein
MSALIIRLPEEKRTRLKLVAKSRKVSVTKLIEEMTTILLADFDAETRFELRAARGRGRLADGLALLDKAAGKRTRSKRSFVDWCARTDSNRRPPGSKLATLSKLVFSQTYLFDF